jgi:tRNA(Ile)-lysidine synthase TilS/MesJ
MIQFHFFQALEEYNMIRDDDKVLVCLSGGKDSLSLLHSLRQYQFYAKKKVGLC